MVSIAGGGIRWRSGEHVEHADGGCTLRTFCSSSGDNRRQSAPPMRSNSMSPVRTRRVVCPLASEVLQASAAHRVPRRRKTAGGRRRLPDRHAEGDAHELRRDDATFLAELRSDARVWGRADRRESIEDQMGAGRLAPLRRASSVIAGASDERTTQLLDSPAMCRQSVLGPQVLLRSSARAECEQHSSTA